LARYPNPPECYLPQQEVRFNGTRVRYIKLGEGPPKEAEEAGHNPLPPSLFPTSANIDNSMGPEDSRLMLSGLSFSQEIAQWG